MAEKGRLRIQCFQYRNFIPIDGCKATITAVDQTGLQRKRSKRVTEVILQTDSSGLTETIELDAPPRANSESPSGENPYSLYNIRIEKEGFRDFVIDGCQVFADETAYQPAHLEEEEKISVRPEVITVQPNRLNGDFPNKIPEEETKPLPPPSSGVVLPNPVVPEFITVHEGAPASSGRNHTILYRDYIKNVASSEIYSTWPRSALEANIFCIISFTLNRIYTEWYRSRGYNFDITNSTAFDQAFSYGRNTYDNINVIVDEIFSTYIKRIGRKQPLFSQYCNGTTVTCPNWLSQWGSKYLGDQGRNAVDILKYYYGSNIELTTAPEVKGSPQSYPGFSLTIGSKGNPVRSTQEFLNRISINYPLIPKVAVDGIYGPKSAQQVKVFQSIFGLPQTGVVDYKTWYKISAIYTGVTKIAELN